MATKKREIYARAAVQLRTHQRAFKAEALCPGAMGLYLFLLLDSRGELTDGLVAAVVAEASWGGKESYRRKQADALVAVGLVERIDDQLHVVKYDEHNDTPSDVEASREKWKKSKRTSRSQGDVSEDTPVTPPDVPISYSISTSGSGSREGVQGEERPPWFDDAIATVEMQTGVTLRPADCWLRYFGHRRNKGVATSQSDAVYWLTTVMVPEARKELRADADKRERDAKFDRERSGRAAFVEPQALTAEQQAELAKRFPMTRRKGAA